MKLRLHTEMVSFPPTKEPVWASFVDRWYQLDRAAFSLTHFAWNFKKASETPVAIFLGCAGGSNQSDFLFASEGANSAKKFAHTLPNVRASSVLQVLEWHGPLLCLQKDPFTLATALQQAVVLYPKSHTWILNFNENTGECALIECNAAIQHSAPFFSIADLGMSDLNKTDIELINWLRHIEQHVVHR